MPLPRVLEPEVMDTPEEARDYDAMDHAVVNARFCDDLLAETPDLRAMLDVGTGTALIPIALCQRAPEAHVLGIDLARAMLVLAADNVRRAGLADRIELRCEDAKALPHGEGAFRCVVSNSIVHHIPEPACSLREMVRVLAPGGLLFVRDLARPETDADVSALVDRHAAGATPNQRALFDASLRAALTLSEVRTIARELGVAEESTRLTGDRHWTLAWRKGASSTYG